MLVAAGVAVVAAAGTTALVTVGAKPAARVVPLVRVIDGDTVVVNLDGADRSVRFIGINAPETTRGHHDCDGQAATNAVRDLTADGHVEIVADLSQGDTDKYDRLLRYVQDGGVDVGRELVRRGLAHEYTYDQPYERQADYRQMQALAKSQGAGGWSDCGW